MLTWTPCDATRFVDILLPWLQFQPLYFGPYILGAACWVLKAGILSPEIFLRFAVLRKTVRNLSNDLEAFTVSELVTRYLEMSLILNYTSWIAT